jgi:hypothetical protein
VVATVAAAVVLLLPSVDGAAKRRAEEARRLAHPVSATEPEARARGVLVTPRVRRQIAKTMSLFIQTAVRRDHPERAWAIVGPALRGGLTRADWKTGSIPVVPYPAAGIRYWHVASSTTEGVRAEVVLTPERGSGLLAKTFLIDLRRADPEGNPSWVVSYWVPEGVSTRQGSGRVTHYSANRLPSLWLLFPLGLLAMTILVPIALFTSQAIADRRALRRYHEQMSR